MGSQCFFPAPLQTAQSAGSIESCLACMQASYGAQPPTAKRPLNGEPFPILTAVWLILLISPCILA